MRIEPLVRRCLYCKTVGGITVHIADVEPHDLIVVAYDFDTQQLPETDFICECCLRNNIPALKKQTDILLAGCA